MILDQQIGAHAAQVEYIGLGWGYSWVSGEGEDPVVRFTAKSILAIDSPNQQLHPLESPNTQTHKVTL